MDPEQIGQIIGILSGAGAIIWGFLNYGWPRLMRLLTKCSNWYLLREILRKKEQLNQLKRQELYDLQEKCTSVIKQSNAYALWQQHEKALEVNEAVHHRLRYRVRFFLLDNSLNKELCATLLLRQNVIQPLFEFELGYVGEQPDKIERQFCSIPTSTGLAHFIEKCEQILEATEDTQGQLPKEEPIRIIVTQANLPRSRKGKLHRRDVRYLWGHFQKNEKSIDGWKFQANKFWIISLTLLRKDLPDISDEQIVLRLIQRACILSVLPASREGWDRNRLDHSRTYGCLFDYADVLPHARYFISHCSICEDCASEILKAEEITQGHHKDFLSALQKWLVDSQKVNSVSKSVEGYLDKD